MARGRGRVVQLISEVLFPRTCVRCAEEGVDVCAACLSGTFGEIPSLVCPACHESSPIGSRHASCSSYLDGLLFAMPYANAVTHGLLRRWKFDYVRSVEPHLQRLMEHIPLEEILAGSDWTVVPVPLHERKRRERGFDQAAWIAKTVADRMCLPAVRALERTRYTPQQSRQEVRSKQDLKGAFHARIPLEGRVILCDDVFTSGATMEAAAQVCKEAGATSVWGVTIAKG